MERLAAKAKSEGDFSGAAEFYRQMAGHSKGAVTAHLELAHIYTRQGQPQKAVGYLREGLKLQPQHPELLTELGFALIRSQKPQDALTALEQAIAAKPSASALNGKGVALDMQGQHTQAQAAYHQGLALAPEDAAIGNNLALSLILSDKYDEAIALLEPLTARPEARSTERQNLALAYGLKGDKERAIALGLKDLPQEQVQENVKFYELYQQNRSAAPLSVAAVPVEPVEAKPVLSDGHDAPAVITVMPVTVVDAPADKPTPVVASIAPADIAMTPAPLLATAVSTPPIDALFPAPARQSFPVLTQAESLSPEKADAAAAALPDNVPAMADTEPTAIDEAPVLAEKKKADEQPAAEKNADSPAKTLKAEQPDQPAEEVWFGGLSPAAGPTLSQMRDAVEEWAASLPANLDPEELSPQPSKGGKKTDADETAEPTK